MNKFLHYYSRSSNHVNSFRVNCYSFVVGRIRSMFSDGGMISYSIRYSRKLALLFLVIVYLTSNHNTVLQKKSLMSMIVAYIFWPLNPNLTSVFLLHVWILLHTRSLFLENNRKSKNYFPETVVNSHTFDHFQCVLGPGIS